MAHLGAVNAGARILVIDDDPDIAKLLIIMLTPLGFAIHHACDGREGLRKAYQLQPDLVILDIMMPAINGWEVCSRLRELSDLPILMLTSCGSEADLVRGFELGADDYIKKPFSRAELEVRLRSLLRRRRDHNGNGNAEISQYKDDFLDINLETQVVERNGSPVALSSTEYNLLSCLVRNMGRTVMHGQILREVWGSEYGNVSGTLSLYIHFLRKKLEDVQSGHKYIYTQWGRGYCFMPVNEN